MSIINEKPLTIIIITRSDAGTIIRSLFRNCVWEFSGGGSGSVEDICETGSTFLSGDSGPDDGDDAGEGEDGF